MITNVEKDLITTTVSSNREKGDIEYISAKMVIFRSIDDADETEIPIGHLKCTIFNAQRYSSDEIIIQCDGVTDDVYETIHSVRIFSDEFMSLEFEESDDKDFFEDMFEGNTYHDNTVNVFGVIALISDVKIQEEYRNLGIGTKLISEFINYSKIAGIDFLMLKPYPTEQEHLKLAENSRELDNNKLKYEVDRLVKFYSQFGFTQTIGMTSDGVYLALDNR